MLFHRIELPKKAYPLGPLYASISHLTDKESGGNVPFCRVFVNNVGGCWQGSDMDTLTITQEAEQILHDAAETLTSPRAGECLTCFVARQMAEFGCNNTHRFALHYRDQKAPRASALLSRLSRMGACCCDCEIFFNAYALRLEVAKTKRPGDDFAVSGSEDLPGCAGVRAGSTQPCVNWVRIPRGGYY